jgi:FkbM family methyltransferase
MEKPPLYLRAGIATYLFFAAIGFRRFPGFNGVFYRLYHRLTQKRGVIALTTRTKTRLSIDLRDDIIATSLIEYGEWEPSLTRLLERLVRPGMTVVDIGAHVGYYTTLCARLVGKKGRVISFEPEPYNFSLLTHNTQSLDNCTIFNRGVSNAEGSATLYLAEGNLGAHSMHVKSGSATTIQTVVLDDFLSDTTVDVVKMDIEGNEPQALAGMQKILSHTTYLIFEYIPGYVSSPEEMFTQLSQAGFTLYELSHDTGELLLLASIPTEKRVFNIVGMKEALQASAQ